MLSQFELKDLSIFNLKIGQKYNTKKIKHFKKEY